MPDQQPPLTEETTLAASLEEFFETCYKEEIEKLASVYPIKRSLEVSYRDLEAFSPEIADMLIEEPEKVIKAAEFAVYEISKISVVKSPEVDFKPHIRFFDLPDMGLMVQDIGAEHVGKLVFVQGVVTKRAEVRHRVRVAVYRCQLCDAVKKVVMAPDVIPPKMCEECNRKTMKFSENESEFIDVQRAEIQEILERLRGGSPASHIDLVLEDDIVNSIVPGEKVDVVGIPRRRSVSKGGEQSTASYATYIDVVHIRRTDKEFEEVAIGSEEEKKIIELSKDPQIFEKIKRSIAPSIYGHEEVKEALALQLFGGTPDKYMPDGSKIRSDIHILLIGDPGAAKTRMLQYVKTLAPKSVYVSGKSVTGAGLTATAEKDELGGESGWVLKAGALVLASGGIAAIDEFDKIDAGERAALHEVMESQTVSVAKAGIVAQFRAKTSILAAANPKEGRFDPNVLPGHQFDIPPTLLSRFDLIFPIKDVLDEEKDRSLARHILKAHALAGKQAQQKKVEEAEELLPPIETDLLRKYIAYARVHVKPVLTPAAMAKIEDYYAELRRLGKTTSTIPITPRQIEGLVRLSEASAKARLSNTVDIADAERAIRLLDFVSKQVYTDRETGKLDIDIIAIGQPKSKIDKIHTVLRVMRQLESEMDEVPRERLIAELGEYGIDEETANNLIEEMKNRGDLFEPKSGQTLKTVKKYD